MTTATVYLTGEAHWAKLKKPDDKYNNWCIDLKLDEEGMLAFKKSGMQLKINEGKIKLRRPVQRLIKGDLVKFDPPSLLDENNDPLDVLVGNGSRVTCKVSVYDTQKGKGHRLDAVRVEDLVEYEKEEIIGDIEVPF